MSLTGLHSPTGTSDTISNCAGGFLLVKHMPQVPDSIVWGPTPSGQSYYNPKTGNYQAVPYTEGGDPGTAGAYYSATQSQFVAPPSTGGTLGDSDIQPQQPAFDPYAELRGQINTGWDSFISGLDAQMGALGGQRSSQEQIVNLGYGQGVKELDVQKGLGISDLDVSTQKAETQRSRSLKDLAENIRNSMQAGSNYLGSMGAGDSSAADQYSFALNKMGTRNRTDINNQTAEILGDIDLRRNRLQELYGLAKSRLTSERDTKMLEVSQWFADAQNQIRQAKGSAELGRSESLTNLSRDILNAATNAISQISTNNQSQLSALQNWATGQAQQLGVSVNNMATQSNVAYNPIQGQPLNSTINTNAPLASRAQGGLFNSSPFSDEDKNKFNNSLFT